MKKMLVILIAFLLCLSLTACFIGKIVDMFGKKSQEMEQNETIDNQKDESSDSLQDQSTATEIKPVETALPDLPQDSADDFQAGIPEEYRLKQNVPPDWDKPLPTSETPLDLIFFSPLGGMGGGSGNASPLPDLKTIAPAGEVETFFNAKILKTEEKNNDMARINRITYHFEQVGDDEPYLSIAVTACNSAEDAEMILGIFGAEPIENPIGVKTTMYHFFGITGIYILTSDNMVIELSANYLDNQYALMMDYAKLVFQRVTGQP